MQICQIMKIENSSVFIFSKQHNVQNVCRFGENNGCSYQVKRQEVISRSARVLVVCQSGLPSDQLDCIIPGFHEFVFSEPRFMTAM